MRLTQWAALIIIHRFLDGALMSIFDEGASILMIFVPVENAIKVLQQIISQQKMHGQRCPQPQTRPIHYLVKTMYTHQVASKWDRGCPNDRQKHEEKIA